MVDDDDPSSLMPPPPLPQSESSSSSHSKVVSFPPSSVRVMAETMGVSPMQDEALREIAEEVTFR